MNACNASRRSATDISLNIVLTAGIVIAYVPQYYRIAERGSSYGISPHYALFHALVATQQLASTAIVYAAPSNVFECIKHKTLRGLDVFGALLGFIQACVQWLCPVVLLVYVVQYSPQPNPDTESSASALKFLWMLLAYNLLILVPSIYIVIDPQATKNIGPPAFFAGWSAIVLAPLSSAFVLFAGVAQLPITFILQSAHSLSALSLATQTPLFALLAVSWFERLRPGMAQYSPRGFSEWYRYGGWIVFNYGCTAVVDLLLLTVLAGVSVGRISSGARERASLLPW